MVLIAAIAFSPALRHVLDHDQVDVSLLHAGEHPWPSTRNVTVRDATLDEARALLSSHGEVLAPLVSPGEEDRPVRLVATYRRSDRHDARAPFHGVIRDIWWEGLSDEERAGFAKHGVVLSSDVKVLDLGAPIDLLMYSMIVGLVTLLMGGFVLSDWLRHRRSA